MVWRFQEGCHGDSERERERGGGQQLSMEPGMLERLRAKGGEGLGARQCFATHLVACQWVDSHLCCVLPAKLS